MEIVYTPRFVAVNSWQQSPAISLIGAVTLLAVTIAIVAAIVITEIIRSINRQQRINAEQLHSSNGPSIESEIKTDYRTRSIDQN